MFPVVCGMLQEEDDGYLMTLLFDGQKDSSELLIFDAKSVAKGEREGGVYRQEPWERGEEQ